MISYLGTLVLTKFNADYFVSRKKARSKNDKLLLFETKVVYHEKYIEFLKTNSMCQKKNK